MTEIEIPVYDSKEDAQEAICICEPNDTRFGTKLSIDSPYEARTDIKNLDWQRTHRAWDPTLQMWEVDVDSLAYCITQLSKSNYSISVTREALDILE